MSLTDDFQGVRPADYVAGTACFYRKEVFDRIGLLNKYSVMYNEDVEFCLRVRNQTDYKVCMFAEILVKHNVDASTSLTNKGYYYTHRNLILILKKYCPKYIPKAFFAYLREVVKLLILSMLKLRISYFIHTPYIIMGARNGLIKGESDQV